MMKNRSLLILLAIIVISMRLEAQKPDTLKDFDGNIYKTVTIGSQVWMKTNLKTTHYSNGASIQNVSGNDAWIKLTTGAYCKYNNSPGQDFTYGKLYNWYAVNDSNKLCPAGWHVPSNSDWKLLFKYLGGEMVAGEKLKEAGITHWESPNNRATNSSNFTGLPGGCRNADGVFANLGDMGIWWSSTAYNAQNASYFGLNYHFGNVNTGNISKKVGYSVRCVKD